MQHSPYKELCNPLYNHLDYQEASFDIINSYFYKSPEKIVKHQLESFNYFIQYQAHQTLQMFNPTICRIEEDKFPVNLAFPLVDKYALEIHISFYNLKFMAPQFYENTGAAKLLYPNEARLRNISYGCVAVADVKIEYFSNHVDGTSEPVIQQSLQGCIINDCMPVMVRSMLCNYNRSIPISPTLVNDCTMDCGGYFIVKGNEKVVIGQERAAENRVYVFDGKNTSKWHWVAEIKCVPDYKCVSPKQIEIMISNKHNGYGFPIFVSIPKLKSNQYIPIWVLFRALGAKSDKEICQYIFDIQDSKYQLMESYMIACMNEPIVMQYNTTELAIEYIMSKCTYIVSPGIQQDIGHARKCQYTLDLLSNDVFPHCQDVLQKRYMLGYMAKRVLMTAIGWIPPDNRDCNENKRIDMTGTVLNNMFRNHFHQAIKNMTKQINKEIKTGTWRHSWNYASIIHKSNWDKFFKFQTIKSGVLRALSTGDFSTKQTNANKVGVAQMLNRLNYVGFLSHLRRLNNPIGESGDSCKPRQIHTQSWGFIDPLETPEGSPIGLVKALSILTTITVTINSSVFYDLCKKWVIPFTYFDKTDETEHIANSDIYTKLFINGAWIGVTDDPHRCYTELKRHKHEGSIHIYTSIVFHMDRNEIKICTDGGRMVRPLLRMRDGKILLTRDQINQLSEHKLKWQDLFSNCIINESVMEYIDIEEQTVSKLINPPYRDEIISNHNIMTATHAEIHASTILGAISSTSIPYLNHNPATRDIYQCAMAKQAIGIYATNYEHRQDKTSYILSYPSIPLVESRWSKPLRLHNVPSGTQCMVAIISLDGYNQEDSIYLNKASIDRGLFSATIFHTEKDEDKGIVHDDTIRKKPNPIETRGVKYANYDKIGPDGFIPVNHAVNHRDVIMAKIMPICINTVNNNNNGTNKSFKYEDQSKVYRQTEESFIHMNSQGRNGDGGNYAKVTTRTYRKPVIADKFASEHAQKGTVSCIRIAEDLPFTENGLQPDIIINSHAFPSRMTAAQILESVMGILLLELGRKGDGTAYSELDTLWLQQMLSTFCASSEFLNMGETVMYDGRNGTQYASTIFMGPVYYQRLKHMVNDKQHSRAMGQRVALTNQPAEGRAKDGGLRVGEMERDVIVAHGASHFMHDRFYHCSDGKVWYKCNKCGLMSVGNDGTTNWKKKDILPLDYKKFECLGCKNRSDFDRMAIPQATKVLSQELNAIGIQMHYIT